MVASVIANSNRDPEETPDPYQPKDFFPGLPEAVPAEGSEQSAEDMLAVMKANMQAIEFFGGGR